MLSTTLALLIALLSGVCAQVQLVQSGAEVKKPGESLRISCKASGFSFNENWIHWIRQPPGKGLEWVGRIYPGDSDTRYNPSFQGKVTISTDKSINTMYLHLNSLKDSDTAMYYCVSPNIVSGSDFDHWGSGTQVTVSSASTQGPSVFPLAPCCNDKTPKTLGCLVTGFLPEPVEITWATGSLNRTEVVFPSTFNEASSHYSTVSLVTVSGELTKEKVTCRVEHKPSNSIIHKNITVCATSPSVKLFHTACHPGGDSQSTIHLLCLITGFTPGDIKVSWLVNGEEAKDLYPNTAEPKIEGKLASTYSELNITQDQWLHEKTYTCRATIHGTPYLASARRCIDSEARGVSVYLLPPSPIDLYINNSTKLVCLVIDLTSKKDLHVTWSWDRKKPLNISRLVVKEQLNATITAMSTLPVDTKDWIQGETYRCTVSHPDLPREIEQSITKAQGKRLAPELFLSKALNQEDDSKITLTCLAQNFFPADITVQWLSNQALVQPDQGHVHTTGPYPTSSSRRAFFTFSLLEVKKPAWENNKFTCRVVHEALLNGRILEKTVSKDSGN